MRERNDQFDAIVIGGGIYGLMVALEASRRDLRVALIERDDWGSGTTSAWLRILHGGLRYLQTADLPRFFESVRERRWFLRHFPEWVAPLPCVMPLYATHSHSPLVMRAGLTLNDLLSVHRNRGVSKEHHLPPSRILDAPSVIEALPFVAADELRGGACWSDAVVTHPQRLLQSLLRWCQSNGVAIHNHTEVVKLLLSGDAVAGIEMRDRNNSKLSVQAPIVINATGHWAPDLAAKFNLPIPDTPRLSWAWNIQFDVPCGTNYAAALTARRPDSQVLFLLPWMGRALVGTGHVLIPRGSEHEPVPHRHIRDFVREAAEAAPGLSLAESSISRIFEGRLPARQGDELQLTSRPTIFDHGRQGAVGFYSVWGIKYTTSRAVAEEVVGQAFPAAKKAASEYVRPVS